MLKGEDIRKLSDTDLEFYILGVQEMKRELNSLREKIKKCTDCEYYDRWYAEEEK